MVGEKVDVDIEEDNAADPRAVAVRKCGVVVGPVPREAARTMWYFLKRGATIVVGAR